MILDYDNEEVIYDPRPQTPEEIAEEMQSVIDDPDWQPETIFYQPCDEIEQGFPEGSKAISKFYNFRNGHLKVPLSKEEIEEQELAYQKAVEEFAPIQAEIDRIKAHNQKIMRQRHKIEKKRIEYETVEAKSFVETNNIQGKKFQYKSNFKPEEKKFWLRRLKRKKGYISSFVAEETGRILPLPEEADQKPIRPEYTFALTPENYREGLDLELDEYINFYFPLLGITMKDFSETEVLEEDIENYILDVALENIGKQVTEVFKKILAGKFKSGQEIYDVLTATNVNLADSGLIYLQEKYHYSSDDKYEVFTPELGKKLEAIPKAARAVRQHASQAGRP